MNKKKNVSLCWLFPIPDYVYLSQQNVQRDILVKHAKHPVAIQTINICMN